MTPWRGPTGDRRCSAHSSRTGERCRQWAIKGGKVCPAHGGRAPQVAAAARRRVIEQAAAAELARLDVTPLDDPLSELALLAAQIVAWKNMMAEKVNQLSSLRYEGEGSGEQLRAEVALWERALDRCEHVLTAMARLNIDERLTVLAEHHVEMVIWLVSSTLARFGLDIYDDVVSGIVDELIERIDPEKVHQPPVHAIEAPRGPELSSVCEDGMHGRCLAYVQQPNMPESPPWPQRCPCECHRP